MITLRHIGDTVGRHRYGRGAPYEPAFRHAHLGFATLTADGAVLEANPALCQLLGHPSGIRRGSQLTSLVTGDSRTAFADALTEVLAGGAAGRRFEVRLDDDRWCFAVLTRLASPRPAALLQLEDISERKAVERQLSEQASRDALTGVANRLLLLRSIEPVLCGPWWGTCALLYADIDRFKQVNDAYGHAGGDALLVTMARRLRTLIRPEDLVARIGGDEFVVFCRHLSTPTEAVLIAERMVAALCEPVPLAAGEIARTVSVGIAHPVSSDASADSLLADADTAMYQAKKAGGNRFVVFAPPMRHAVLRRHETELRLRAALRRNELELHYQPVVDLRTGRFSGVEALVRWPVERDVEAAIGIAEESELIQDLGDWVVSTALSDRVGGRLSDDSFELAVNVSPRQLVRANFISSLVEMVSAAGVSPGQVCFEVTETALADNVAPIVEVLGQLRDEGFRLAIDDFGTGHASLTYLARFPVHVVKVDRSFIAGLGVDPASGVIVRSVVAMAHALGMTVTAEGVESLAQLECVLDAGCDFAQGFLFAAPLPQRQCVEALANSVPWPVGFADRRSRRDQMGPALLVDPARRYRLLLDLARDITGRLDLGDVLHSTFVALHQLVDFDGGSIQLVDGGYISLAATDPPATVEALSARIPVGHGVGGRIAASGEPRYIADINQDPDVPAVRRTSSVSSGVRSYFGVPLITEGAVIGVLQIDSKVVNAFSEEDRFTVLAFTPIVAAAVQNARIFERETAVILPRPRRADELRFSGGSAS